MAESGSTVTFRVGQGAWSGVMMVMMLGKQCVSLAYLGPFQLAGVRHARQRCSCCLPVQWLCGRVVYLSAGGIRQARLLEEAKSPREAQI